ncbi:MAG: glycosyltransferase family 2 protein [Phycisphaeraceae bacterium]|nr:glycosyltransferase family 2 protein [Phycisphaeraceae bacterium]
MSTATVALGPEVSIVVPVLNEEDNIMPLLDELRAAIFDGGMRGEVIVVDDGSDDGTPGRLAEAAGRFSWLVVLRRERRQGQSAAMFAGIAAARAPVVAMLDGDLQNDPADLPPMIRMVQRGEADMVQGDRSQKRVEGLKRKLTTAVGRAFRRTLLKDPIRDTGCTLRVIRADIARRIPLQFMGMHRYIPAYCRLLGAKIVEVSVNHRARLHGTAKYGMLDRAAVGLYDVLAVRWMLRRFRDTRAERVAGDARRPTAGEQP